MGETTVNKRIEMLKSHTGKSARQFSIAAGVLPAATDKIIRGDNNPGFEYLEKILKTYRFTNAEWLLIGEGEMLKQTAPIPNTNEKVFTKEKNNLNIDALLDRIDELEDTVNQNKKLIDVLLERIEEMKPVKRLKITKRTSYEKKMRNLPSSKDNEANAGTKE